MLKIAKLLVAAVLFLVSFSAYSTEETPLGYFQLAKHKKTEKKKKHKKKYNQQKYELTLCCITRDEAEYLPEWIEFHIKQGIEHIYIYDNLTIVNLHDALQEYVQQGLIDIISWPYEHDDDSSWGRIQLSCYRNYLQAYGKETEWCAFIDTDEFLFCPDGKNLREFLKSYRGYQELMVCWIIYGTSGVWQAPQGKLIQTLLHRGNDHFWLAMKPIVKTRDVTRIQSMHYFDVRTPSLVIDENFRPLSSIEGGYCPKIQSVNKIRINHYVFRDGKFFEEVKIPRYLKRGVSREGALDFESVTNRVYDDSILRVCR